MESFYHECKARIDDFESTHENAQQLFDFLRKNRQYVMQLAKFQATVYGKALEAERQYRGLDVAGYWGGEQIIQEGVAYSGENA